MWSRWRPTSRCATSAYDVEKDLTLISNTLRLSKPDDRQQRPAGEDGPELIVYAKKNPARLRSARTATAPPRTWALNSQGHDRHSYAACALPRRDFGVTDLIGGGIQLMMINTPVSGRWPAARCARWPSPRRSARHLPDVPRLPNRACRGSRLPPGRHHRPGQHAKEIVSRLNTEIRTALASPAVRERFKTLGADTVPAPGSFWTLAPRDRQVGQDRKLLGRID